MIKGVLTVTHYTYLEIIKSKILLQILILGGILMGVVFVAQQFTYGVPERVVLDVGLGALSLSTVGIALFMGTTLISNEIENRTVYMTLSRPISRSAFLIGRICGMSLVLLINITILGALTVIFCSALGGIISPLIFQCIFLSGLESLIILTIVIFVSLFANNVISVITTIGVYFIGHAVSGTKDLVITKMSPVLSATHTLLSYVVPNFGKLNLKDYVLYKQSVGLDYIASATLYGTLYFLVILISSCFIFENKNLD